MSLEDMQLDVARSMPALGARDKEFESSYITAHRSLHSPSRPRTSVKGSPSQTLGILEARLPRAYPESSTSETRTLRTHRLRRPSDDLYWRFGMESIAVS